MCVCACVCDLVAVLTGHPNRLGAGASDNRRARLGAPELHFLAKLPLLVSFGVV